MKSAVVLGAALVVGVILAFSLFGNRNANALSVNQVGADPLAYRGNIQVTGIMAGISDANPQIFGMFDVKELQCTTPNCNKVYIPVKNLGPMPKPGDEIVVSGSFERVGNGLQFNAQKIKVVRHHQIGG
jgi:hypothetical protein